MEINAIYIDIGNYYAHRARSNKPPEHHARRARSDERPEQFPICTYPRSIGHATTVRLFVTLAYIVIFTKLDLRGAYNFIRIKAGKE